MSAGPVWARQGDTPQAGDRQLVDQLAALGMSKGAVLAYFISGPVTKISNLVILQAAFKRTILIQYLAIGILGALIFGIIYNLF